MTASPRRRRNSAAGKASSPSGRQPHTVIAGRKAGATEWRELRARWQARLPQPCPRCPELVQPWDLWDLDHVGVPVALGATDADIRPAHRLCNQQAGGALAQELTKLGAAVARGDVAFLGDGRDSTALHIATTPPEDPEEHEPDPSTPEPSATLWDRCDWLDGLRTVPADATWPRLMSPPHPAAVGSYGAEAAAWFHEHRGMTLRWWQALAVTRLLEHDDAGELVWLDALVSTARQVGKSIGLDALASWRMHAAELFGEPQLVMHTGKDVAVCAEVQRPMRRWAREHGYGLKLTNGQQEVTMPGDIGRWLVRAMDGVYGYPASLALADEAWKINPTVIEDGLEPVLTERRSGQLVLFSTAHRRSTGLVPVRRAAAMARFDDPGASLLLEWSALRGAEIEDRAAWRMASPHWTPNRERLLTAKLDRATNGISEDPDEDDPVESFRSQFLNVWPRRRIVTTTRAEMLVERDAWDHAGDMFTPIPDGPVTVAVEDFFGLGAAGAASALLPDGRVLTWGDLFGSRAEAYAWASFTMGRREGCRVLVGASMSDAAEAFPGVPVESRNFTATSSALPLVRSLVRSGRLVHSGGDRMAEQVTVRVVPTSSGGLALAHRGVRADLTKAMAWAVADRALSAAEPLDFFVY